MRGILRDRLYNKHYNKLINSRSESSKKSVNTISSVTILAPAKHHPRGHLTNSYKYFGNLNIACDIYVLQEKNEIAEVDQYISVIKREECEWYGVPSQEILIQWLSNKTDLLILSDPDRLPLMKYLCAASNCKLKSALAHENLDAHELDIDLWIEAKDTSIISLAKQCELTYTTLTKLGIRPPVIG